MADERTNYSAKIPGEYGNHNLAVRFDKSRGFIGISQFNEDGSIERVLLSPKQMGELYAFIGTKRRAVA